MKKANELADRFPAVVYVVLAVSMAIAIWQVEEAKKESERQSNRTLGSVIGVQIENCRNDHVFRRQYKTRGEVEKAEGPFLLSLARERVAAGEDPTGSAQRFINRYAPLAREIKIIPLPDCREAGEKLRRAIANSGVEIARVAELPVTTRPLRPGYPSESGSPEPSLPTPGGVGGPPESGDVDNGAGKGGGGGGGPEPRNPGSEAPPAPPKPGSDPASAPPSSGASGGQSRSPAPPTPPPSTPPPSKGLVPDTVEAAGKAAGEAAEGARGVVESAGKSTDCVLRGGC